MHIRIDFTKGAIKYVTLPLCNYAIAWQARNDLHEAIGEAGEYWLPQLDPMLYCNLAPLYRLIAAQMSPTFNPATLTPQSRYEFFCCGHPVEANGQLQAQFCGLDRLLGYEILHPAAQSADKAQAPKAIVTSGSILVDLEAELRLVFKAQAQSLIDQHSLPYLNSLLTQTIRRQDPNALKEAQRELDIKFLDNLVDLPDEDSIMDIFK